MSAAPAHLAPGAAAVWGEVYLELARKRLTAAQIEAYAVCVARMRDAQARVDAEGIIIADEKGRPIPHPALAIEKSCRAELEYATTHPTRKEGKAPMLDRLQPAARHAVLLLILSPLVAALAVITSAVLQVAGIDGIDWPGVMHSACSAGAVVMASGLATWVTCWVTPLTRQYGAGAQR